MKGDMKDACREKSWSCRANKALARISKLTISPPSVSRRQRVVSFSTPLDCFKGDMLRNMHHTITHRAMQVCVNNQQDDQMHPKAVPMLYDLRPCVSGPWGSDRISPGYRAAQGIELICSRGLRRRQFSMQLASNMLHKANTHIALQSTFTCLAAAALAVVGGTSTCTCNVDYHQHHKENAFFTQTVDCNLKHVIFLNCKMMTYSFQAALSLFGLWSSTFVCAALVSSFFAWAETFPLAAAAAGLDVLPASALTVVVPVVL